MTVPRTIFSNLSFVTFSLLIFLMLFSNSAFSCTGKDYEETVSIYNELIRQRQLALTTGNMDSLSQYSNEAMNKLRLLPVTCQNIFQQAMQQYQPQGPDYFDKLPL